MKKIVISILISLSAFFILLSISYLSRDKVALNFKSCNYKEVYQEFLNGKTPYTLPPIEKINPSIIKGFKKSYMELYTHALTHEKVEQSGDMIKDRCEFLLREAFKYRESDENLENSNLTISLVNNGNFDDLNTEIRINNFIFCLGFVKGGDEFSKMSNLITFKEMKCSEFVAQNKYEIINGFKKVVIPDA